MAHGWIVKYDGAFQLRTFSQLKQNAMSSFVYEYNDGKHGPTWTQIAQEEPVEVVKVRLVEEAR